MLEISLLAYATRVSSDGRGEGILFIGDCKQVRELELWLLLPLNIAGTMLIGTSSYVMQVVSAPERAEIDLAHAYAQYVPVAGIRFRDLRTRVVSRSRQIIWWTLCLSSVPIHFLLNVAVFSSVQASNTGVLVVEDNFDGDEGWTYCGKLPGSATTAEQTACKLYLNYTMGQTKHNTVSECLRQYSNGFQTNASSVIVVTDASSQRRFNPPSGTMPLRSEPYNLPCRETEDGSRIYAMSDPGFDFAYEPVTGSTQITMNFLPYCANRTNTDKNDSTSWKIESTPRSQITNITSYDELALYANSQLADISSIKAFFSAFQFRYWGTAWSVGDFTRPDLVDLMQNKDPRSWICPREDMERSVQCDAFALQQQNKWRITPESMLVKECHVLTKEELCALRYSSGILVITLVFDVVKLLAMIAALKLIKRPLTTLGDVAASFLSDPDPCTENCGALTEKRVLEWIADTMYKINFLGYARLKECWGTAALSENARCPRCGKRWKRNDMISSQAFTFLSFDVEHRKCITPTANSRTLDVLTDQLFDWLSSGGPWWSTMAPVPPPKSASSRRWATIPTRSGWICSSLLLFPAIAAAIAYFTINFRSVLARKLLNPWIIGFDAPDLNSMLTGWLSNTKSIYLAAILVNLPQVAFSTLYFTFNATLTMMHTAHEWAKFSVERKALRVSSPRGQ